MTTTHHGDGGGEGAAPFGFFERQLTLRYLRAKQAEGGVALIAVISFVGVMLAAFGLIAVMSVMNGFSHLFFSQVIGVQPHVTVDTRGMSEAARNELIVRVEGIDGVVSVTPMVQQTVLARASGVTEAVIVIGVPSGTLREFGLVADSAEPDDALSIMEDPALQDNVILAGCDVARQFGLLFPLPLDYEAENPGEPRPCGLFPSSPQRLELIAPTTTLTPFSAAPKRKAYDLAGIFRIGNQEFDRRFVFMELAQAQRLLGRNDVVDLVAINVEAPRALPRFERLIEDASSMSPIEAALREAAQWYGIRSWQDQHAAYANALRVERMMMTIILSVLMVITTMNIISGLVMLSKNKGRDIAVLRTMGASQGSIMRVFLMIGALIGTLGTLAGLALGVLFAGFITEIQQFIEFLTGWRLFDPSVYAVAYLPARIETGQIVFVVVWGFTMSCLAALPPARSAARKDPVEALRNE